MPTARWRDACDIVLPMQAGPELSVAATKSFVASLAMLLRLTAAWARDSTMQQGIDRLPERLDAAAELDWSAALAVLARAHSVMTIGRGPTLAIAREAALKLKETCNLHAEAFSSAEFQHGPIALVEPAYPVAAVHAGRSGGRRHRDAAHRSRAQRRFRVLDRGGVRSGISSDLAPDHPDADAICLIQSFYQLLLHVAARRGNDVDRPRHLQKVTRTR